MRRATTKIGAAIGMALLVAASGLASQAIAGAEPAAHQVRYTVTTTSGLNSQIYYMVSQPPSKAAFDANSAQYLTNVKIDVNPDAPWVFETTLENPDQWAIVTASGGLRVNPEFHCEIAVDGQVVVSNNGGSGVQCELPGNLI